MSVVVTDDETAAAMLQLVHGSSICGRAVLYLSHWQCYLEHHIAIILEDLDTWLPAFIPNPSI